MAKLVFKLSDSQELDYPLNAALIRLGRDATNNIVIDNLWISSFHATFYRSMDGRLQVEDLNSSNGTFVNGQRIRALKTLRLGDIVTFGQLDALITPSPEDDELEKESGLPPVVNHDTAIVTVRPLVSPNSSAPVSQNPNLLPLRPPTRPTTQLHTPAPEFRAMASVLPEETNQPTLNTTAATADLARLRGEITVMLQRKDAVLKELSQLEADQNSLAQTKRDMALAAEEARKAVTDSVKEKDAAETALNNAKEEAEKVQAQIRQDQARLQELETSSKAAAEKQAQLQAALKQLEEGNATIQEQITKEKAHLEEIRKQTQDETSLAAAQSELAAQLQTLHGERAAVEQALEKLRQEHQETHEAHAALKEQKAATAAEQQSISENVMASQAEVDELEKTIAELLRRNDVEQRRQREIVQAAHAELRGIQEQTKSAREVREQLQTMQAEIQKLRSANATESARFQSEKQRYEREVEELLNQYQNLQNEIAEAQFTLKEQKFAEVEQLKIEALGITEVLRGHQSDLSTTRKTLDETHAAWQAAENNRTQTAEVLSNLRHEVSQHLDILSATKNQIREEEAKLDSVKKTQEIAEQEQRLTSTQLEQARSGYEIRRKELQESELAQQEARMKLQLLSTQAEQTQRLLTTQTEETNRLRQEANQLETQIRDFKSQSIRAVDEAEAAEKRRQAAVAAMDTLELQYQERESATHLAQRKLTELHSRLTEEEQSLTGASEKQRQEHIKLSEEVEIYLAKRNQLNAALAELSKHNTQLATERQQQQAACNEAVATLERLHNDVKQHAGTKQALMVECQALATKIQFFKDQADAQEHEVRQTSASLESMTKQLATQSASFAGLEKEIQRASMERATWDQIRQALTPLKEEHRTLEQEIHVLRRERNALLEEATRGAKEKIQELDYRKSALESQIQEYEGRRDLLARAITPEWGTIQVVAKSCIKELDLLDDMLSGLRQRNARAETIEQLNLFKGSFLRTLEEFSVVPFSYPPNQILDVRLRKRIAILETQRGGTGPTVILESLRPGYECLQKGEGPPTLLRKCEVVIQSEG